MVLSLPKILGLFALIWLVWMAFRFIEARQKTVLISHQTKMATRREQRKKTQMTHRLICRNAQFAGHG